MRAAPLVMVFIVLAGMGVWWAQTAAPDLLVQIGRVVGFTLVVLAASMLAVLHGKGWL
jgi:hypothetical protein